MVFWYRESMEIQGVDYNFQSEWKRICDKNCERIMYYAEKVKNKPL